MNVWGNVKKISVGGMFIGAMVVVGSLSLTGCLTDDKKDDTTPVAKDSVSTKSVTVGAQANNTLGSFIDLDTYSVLKQSAAEAASATVDIVFAFSGSASSSAVYSPDSAKGGIAGGPGLDIAKNLTTVNHTELKTVDAAKFDAAATVEDLNALYAAGTVAANGRLLVSKGFAFGAKTAGGKIVGLKITDVTTSATGEATIQAKAKW
ncbi:MAG: hypothetical protein JWP91_744 [Fibrobacteres bacterium]|nr:hypothetical protein [Fibrobacterota bacterium]